MKENLTHAIEDYLKAIYSLSREQAASTTALAEHLQIAPASVTGMLQRLAETTPPLVAYIKRQGATLTPEGEKAALEVIRHHRLLETYLHESHGDPIPDPNLVMPQKASIPLSTLRPPLTTTIERVDAEDGEFLRYLQAQSLVPGNQIEVRAFSPFDGNLTLLVNQKEMVLGPAITRHIFVREENP